MDLQFDFSVNTFFHLRILFQSIDFLFVYDKFFYISVVFNNAQ
jgi:hypothetical protein